MDVDATAAQVIAALEKLPEKKTEKKPKEKKIIIPEKAWFVKNGLHLTVIDRLGDYYFCHYEDKPVFRKTGEGFYPRKLPLRDGALIDVVGIPDKEAIEAAPILTATDLYQKIESHILRYLDAPALDRQLFIYYMLFSWFSPKVNTTPYLRFIADTGNGKSRMQRVIGDLCFYPIKAGGSSTPAGIMRLKEQWNGTLLIDEADLRDSTTTNELIKYLNLGFERGQYFIKSDTDNPKQQDIFDPFCPKIIGMRKPFQDNATEGRLLSFSPKETIRKDIPFILPASYDTEVRDLRAAIAVFVLSNWEKVDGEKMIDIRDLIIEPRLKQLALPLSIILQLYADGEEQFRKYLIGRQLELKRVRASSYEGMVFNAVLDAAKDTPRITPGIYERCGVKSGQALSRVLHSIGFKTEVVQQDKTLRILVIPDERTWTNITQRYHYDDANTAPTCPESLKSTRWVAAVEQTKFQEPS
jgi:hypothetical protein